MDGKEAPIVRTNCAFKRFDSEGNEESGVIASGAAGLKQNT